MRKHISLTLLLSLACLMAPAQQKCPESEEYQKAAGQRSMLYRGTLSPQYRFVYNGTFYVETPEFETGQIMYNGRLYSDVLLNIDACRNILVVNLGGVCVDAQTDFVEYAIIGGREYIHLPEGKNKAHAYYQVLHKGGLCFLKRVYKIYSVQSGDHNGEDIGYYDPKYKRRIGDNGPEVECFFARKCTYHILSDGVLKKISSKGSILKMIDKSKRAQVKKMAAEKGLDGAEISLEQYGVGVLRCMEEIGL